MKKLQHILLVAGLLLAGATCVMAQVPQANIRYVRQEKSDGTGGKYTNDGKSWATAKNNIQDAINALVAAKALPGEVWVGAGTYAPTESTESSGGSTLYMSFKIPAGITVRGGFPADGKIKHMAGANIGQDSIDAYITSPDQRPMVDYTEVGDFSFCQTILTGDLSSQRATFVYDDNRNQFTTTFYGNSYHVVTFATNGFHPDGHAKALDTSKGEAAIDNVIIEHGNAHFTGSGAHPHEAYGGGIYMVKGSHVYSTCVRQCEATRAGGGIYMDGGGIADHVYVSECQALGIGTTYGFGGGICMEDGTYDSSDATKGMYPTVLRRSGVTGSVARNGGGLAIYCNNTAYKNRLAVSAMLVSNNVAQNEAGGIYLYQGGALAQATVVNNKCIGSGIAVNGMVNGRSGGIYVRDFGNIGNSVIWGNECNNRNIQYAGSRSGNEEAKKPILRCVMVSKADYADWSGVVKYQVKDLNTDNTGTAHANYPAFKNPTPTAGYISDIYYRSLMAIDNDHPAYSWKVEYSSALTNAGVQTIDLDTAGVTPAANKSLDIMGEVYSSHPTLGGYTSTSPVASPWSDGRGTMHLFVDPNAKYTDKSNNIGDSWDNAAHNLSDILHRMQQTLDAFKTTGKQPSAFNLTKLVIHVKEGTVTNNGAYSTGRVRNNTLTIPVISDYITEPLTIEILGSYSSDLTGRDLSARNPLKTPTIITGDIVDNYDYNVAHLVTFDGARNVTFDGFQLRNGNASSLKQENTNPNGAAFTIRNAQNITIKNCLVANCQAEVGAAVYAENSVTSFENCIFHNNASTQQVGLAANTPGIIYSGGTSTLTFDHCDVLRNVGFASWLTSGAHQRWTNSIFYGNLNAPVDDTNDTESSNTHYVMSTAAFGGTVANASGSYCLFDGKSASFEPRFGSSRFDLSYVFNNGANSNYPRFINPTKNAGISPAGDNTYYGRSTSFEPYNTNPMVNAASYDGDHSTWGTDISTQITRDYGGLPDIGAVENHKEVSNEENANSDGQLAFGVGYYVRDYRDGSGNVDYTAGGDGTSWANAINGNAYYYSDGTHSGDRSKPGEGHYETRTVITWTETATTIPTNAEGVMLKDNSGRYLQWTGATLTTVTEKQNASLFVIQTSGAGYTVQVINAQGSRISLGYTIKNAGNKNASSSFSSGTNSVWTISDRRSGTISFSYKRKDKITGWIDITETRYLASGGISETSTTWTFYKRNKETREEKVWVPGGEVDGVIGLQYAVNSANAAFVEEGVSIVHKKSVWVAAGTYTNATGKAAGTDYTSAEKAKHIVSQPYAFEMKEGVDVIGGFPAEGSPGEQQRDPKQYVTILQPQATKPTITYSLSGDVKLTNIGWNTLVTQQNNNESVSTGRVLVQGSNFTVPTQWDGFTIRHGYLMTARMNNIGAQLGNLKPGDIMNAGGAGVLLQENGILTNCEVKDNVILCSTTNSKMIKTGAHVSTKDGNGLYTFHMAGAGIFMTGEVDDKGLCNGAGAIVENCVVSGNQIINKAALSGKSQTPENTWAYGMGVYQNGGQMYNTIIHDNIGATVEGNVKKSSFGTGNGSDNEMYLGGVFVASGNFYNNTVVRNMATTLYGIHDNHCCFAGVHVFDKARIYNSVIAENVSHWSYESSSGTNPGNGIPVSAFTDTGADRNSRDPNKVWVSYSYIDVNVGQMQDSYRVDLISQNDAKTIDGDGNPKKANSNIYINRAQFATTTQANLNPVSKVLNLTTYQLLKNSPAINTATDNIPNVTIPDVDAEYKDRIFDCVIDMGAYEYNGAYDIVPTVVGNVATFYVTPRGARLATANDPENAACADKLQIVLDAAGRYKYQNPAKQVIVKLANDYVGQNPADPGDAPDPFTYYANRSTNPLDQDVRLWSVMVPRGVEVWGGYSNLPMKMQDGKVVRDSGFGLDAWSNDHNGFYSGTTDLRDITGNATYIDATYANKLEHTSATTYHTVTFTDRIFDGNGNPYLSGDNDLTQNSSYDPNLAYEDEAFYKHMSDNASITSRSVLDGLFLTGGQANIPASNEQNLQSVHQFGGAAVVEPYAHIRNCIVENNSATYGGALALKEKALVSGCLIRDNEATRGAGIYVFEDGTRLSESVRLGVYTVKTAQGSEAKMSANMPQVYLSTIVRNHAQQGGGLWFTNNEANVRVNSTVLWKNEADDQANVSGAYSPEKPASDKNSTIDFYPFAYSAVQNLRLSGTNNVSLQPQNKNGVRFAKNEDAGQMATDETNYTDFGFYGLTSFSALTRTGMSIQEFDSLSNVYQFAPTDFMALDRKVSNPNAPARTYVEIGARAIDKQYNAKQLMLRLYVAQPEDVDADVAQALASMTKEAVQGAYTEAQKTTIAEYYSQEGSSFAYPFQNLQDALDYIYLMRSTNEYNDGISYIDQYHANDLPFEIMIAQGTYTPTRDLSGKHGESLANTFAIPEGVSLYGGFNVNAGKNQWYGRYVTPKDYSDFVHKPTESNTWVYSTANVNTLSDATVKLTVDDHTYNLVQSSATEMANSRSQIDVNKNNIIEPWEFENQTILSGNATSTSSHGVYHIVTICPDENVVGILPTISGFRDSTEYAAALGYLPYEYGQYIQFNGLTFQGGRAHSYSSELDEFAKYNYYHGGAALIDGNRYCNNYNDSVTAATAAGASWNASSWEPTATVYKHTGRTNAAGYRDIMTTIAYCRFYDNEAGYGGAISANTEVELFSSSFESNLASYFEDQVSNQDGSEKIPVTYAGQGGAVFSTYSLSAYNTLFANNEARDLTHTSLTSGNYTSYRNYNTGGSNELPGTGGAVYSGLHSSMHLFNCNLVRNMANSYPGAFTMNPNTYNGEAAITSAAAYNQIANTLFWGNEVNSTVRSANSSSNKLFAAQLAVNYGAANRNPMDIYHPYDPFAAGAYPTSQADLDDAAHDESLTQKKFSEMLYFSAYELGRGITAKNDNDFRTVSPHFYTHSTFTFSHVPNPDGGTYPYQNSNIAISADNEELDGPAFMRPSYSAGIDGYMEAADWSPARLNNLTDNGTGKLSQKITEKTIDGETQKVAEFMQYTSSSELPDRSLVKDSSNPYAFTTENVGDYKGDGAYLMARYLANYPYYKNYLSIGAEHYMKAVMGDQEMYRISLDPNPTHDQSFIDIGVYEYIHVPLEPETEDEVDILWVSNFEKPENGLPNGRTWLTPTSDLQRAIETLLASRNGHRKEIRICDGTYSPIYTINGNLSFYIDSKFLNDAATGKAGEGVKSLTIKGGYSREYNNMYDVDLYPTIIRQQTTTNPSAKYDHLIFINDATQRYHGPSYAVSNKYGWENGGHEGIHTFPIQIDGVTLINDQATNYAKGSVIYYRSQTFKKIDYSPIDYADHTTYMATSTTPASITTGEDAGGHRSTDIDNPAKLIISKTTVLGSGSKTSSVMSSAVDIEPAGGNAMIYNSLFHSNNVDPLTASNTLIVNSTFALNNGEVRLMNYKSSEPEKDITSKVFNSVFWRNNNGGYQLELDDLKHNAGGTGDYKHSAETAAIFAYNAYTGGNTKDIEYDDPSSPIKANNYNVGLVDLNTDVTYGPNFNDPENADILLRDFHISPSMRLLNKGNNTHYGDTALATNTRVYDLAWQVSKHQDITTSNRIAAGTIDLGAYEYQYDLNRVLYVDPNKSVSGDGMSWEKALGFGNIQNAIDLAGVAHSNLNKTTYVFVKAASSTNLDLHTGETLTLRDGVQVYGSVMSDYGVECPYTIPELGSTTREYDNDILDAYVSDVLLYGRYGTISPVEGHTRIAGINTNGTAFSTITVDNGHGVQIDNPKLCRTLIDGFEVTPKDDAAATITAPIIHITPYESDNHLATGNVQVGLRNIAVHGYTASGCNVAELDNALLYSTLFHHNTVSGSNAVMKVNQYGYLLNATIEGKTIGANNLSERNGGANATAEAASHIFNSLVNYAGTGVTRHEGTIRTLSGYCYALEDENLNYQLTERSGNIDACANTVPANLANQLKDFVTYDLTKYSASEASSIMTKIDDSYLGGVIGSAKLTVTTDKFKAADRDLLGNFRWQADLKENALSSNIIDRGAFETWRVEKPHFVEFPNYPYPGTCEYIMKDQALMIDPVDINGDASTAAHIPGFVLLQEGASLYGNGREIEIAYAGIERTVKNGQHMMFSVPWNQNMVYNGITNNDRNAVNGLFVVEYETDGSLRTVRTDAGPVYTYDASKRADWQHRVAATNSECWTEMTNPLLPACTGVYTQVSCSNAVPVKGGNEQAELTVRCMGKGKNMVDFIYEELVEEGHKQHTGKSVTLYRHDDAESTAGAADLTDAKNAGWNFIGYPYLISLYHPYTKAIITVDDDVNAELNPGVRNQDQAIAGETYDQFLASSNPYAMDRPQTMWLWYDGVTGPDGVTPVDGTGGFYSVNSWLKEPEAWHVAANVEPVLRVTEGFFVQTHTLKESEPLTFYRPTYRSHYQSASAPYRYYVVSENEQPGVVSPDQVDSALNAYEKIFRNDHVYIVRRDAEGRITESFDLTGRRVEL